MAFQFPLFDAVRLATTSSPVGAVPMTLACWFNTNTGSNGSGALMACGVASGTHRNQIQTTAQAGGTQTILANAIGASGVAGSTTESTASNSSWAHAAGVFASLTSRTAYLNGVAAIQGTADCGSQNQADSIVIGARWATTLGFFYEGTVAEAGIWNVALTNDEIASLADGFTCDRVRPQSLVFYAPLIRDLHDIARGLTISNTNASNNRSASAFPHPRVYA
jgi:hypothetical protein